MEVQLSGWVWVMIMLWLDEYFKEKIRCGLYVYGTVALDIVYGCVVQRIKGNKYSEAAPTRVISKAAFERFWG